MKGAVSKPVALLAVGQQQRAGRRQRTNMLKIAEIADLERHQGELFVDRNFLADHGGRKHLANRIVAVDLGGVLRAPGRRHSRRRCRPTGSSSSGAHAGGVLGVLSRVIGCPAAGLEALRLDAGRAGRIGLERVRDLAIGAAGNSAISTLTLWSSVSKPVKVLAGTRPTSGVMPTRAPGGKTGSAASAGDSGGDEQGNREKRAMFFMNNPLGWHWGCSMVGGAQGPWPGAMSRSGSPFNGFVGRGNRVRSRLRSEGSRPPLAG